eukprot:TRINITY_DN16497_c0_g1_i3.p1 TRINITY_DN16497_c0_g1~~TRINITY_DN16497_c0_g1_i3.p1  ORF type:complete len:168 (-),score=31.37 TRINITY_DN16497_c0_g1_i3:489-992(-)
MLQKAMDSRIATKRENSTEASPYSGQRENSCSIYQSRNESPVQRLMHPIASISRLTAQSHNNLSAMNKLRQESLRRLLCISGGDMQSSKRIKKLHWHFETQYVYTAAFNACSKPASKRDEQEVKDIHKLISMNFTGYSEKKIKELATMFFAYEATAGQIGNSQITDS